MQIQKGVVPPEHQNLRALVGIVAGVILAGLIVPASKIMAVCGALTACYATFAASQTARGTFLRFRRNPSGAAAASRRC